MKEDIEARYQRDYRQCRAVQKRIKALRQAMAQGQPVAKQLDCEKQKLSELMMDWPRGDNRVFAVLCMLSIAMIVVIVETYIYLLPFYIMFWGTPKHRYLLDFRMESAKTWLWMEWVLFSPLLGLSIIMAVTAVLILLWYVQRQFHRRNAQQFLMVLSFIVVGMGMFILCMFVHLIMGPVGSW